MVEWPSKMPSGEGQGGCVVTSDDAIADKIAQLKNFGRVRSGVEEYPGFGINLKFTDLQSVVGLAQLDQLPRRVQRMREIWALYAASLANIDGVALVSAEDPSWFPWFVDIFLPSADLRNALALWLSDHLVGTRRVYPCIHDQDCYGKQALDAPVSERFAQTGLWLPSYVDITDAQIESICLLIQLFMESQSLVSAAHS